MPVDPFADVLLKYIIPTLASVGTIYYIGNKIKNALCKNITDLTIELRTHIGISDEVQKEFDDLKKQLNRIILRNDLKI